MHQPGRPYSTVINELLQRRNVSSEISVEGEKKQSPEAASFKDNKKKCHTQHLSRRFTQEDASEKGELASDGASTQSFSLLAGNHHLKDPTSFLLYMQTETHNRWAVQWIHSRPDPSLKHTNMFRTRCSSYADALAGLCFRTQTKVTAEEWSCRGLKFEITSASPTLKRFNLVKAGMS